MKKNKYIAPVCKEYNVSTQNMMATSNIGFGEGTANSGDVKEEKEEVGIWDLY